MPDYKSMYYHLAGRMATTIEVLGTATEMLKATSDALANLKKKLELAQQVTEDMFINSEEGDSDGNPG